MHFFEYYGNEKCVIRENLKSEVRRLQNIYYLNNLDMPNVLALYIYSIS